MPTLVHPSGKKKIELTDILTVQEARELGLLPDSYILVEDGGNGFKRQVGDSEPLTGQYIMVPSNVAG
ncbi:MAG TPA: hypothetical protein VEI04_03410 [Syntrophobacteria bacterium]|nr:hypothetical protein [Syntrophobacteria bacterium]